MKNEKVKVVQDDAAPVEKEVLAQAIVDISAALKKLRASGLNERAILALVKDDTGISKAEVKRVLDSLAGLRRTYCA